MEILKAEQRASGVTHKPKYMKAPLTLLSGSPEEYPAKRCPARDITHGWHTHPYERRGIDQGPELLAYSAHIERPHTRS